MYRNVTKEAGDALNTRHDKYGQQQQRQTLTMLDAY